MAQKKRSEMWSLLLGSPLGTGSFSSFWLTARQRVGAPGGSDSPGGFLGSTWYLLRVCSPWSPAASRLVMLEHSVNGIDSSALKGKTGTTPVWSVGTEHRSLLKGSKMVYFEPNVSGYGPG